MESYLGSLGIVLVFAQLALFVSAQDCLLASGGRVPPFRDDNGAAGLPSGTQAIIITYQFRCCGNITAWQTYVTPGGSSYDITFQVWRPSPTLPESGCYSIVGENRFTRISLGAGGLVSETPEPSNILSVQPGDVVGYYTVSRDPQDMIGNGIQLDTAQIHDRVWYHTYSGSEPITAGASDCPFPVGSGRSLNTFVSAAPVLSVKVAPFVCLPTPEISLISSSSIPPSNAINSATPTNFASSISPNTNAATAVSTSEGGAAVSTAVMACVSAIGGTAFLLILLSMLVIAYTVGKVHHKRQRTLAEAATGTTDLSMKMQGNEAYISTFHTDECYTDITDMEANLAYRHVSTLSMKMQGNEAYCASTINMADKGHNYEYINPAGTLGHS